MSATSAGDRPRVTEESTTGRDALRQLGDPISALIGRSPAFLRVTACLRGIAASDATVLVEGETGTGKELIARALHYLSRRAPQPFVPVNCGAIPDSLVEDELFGHARGAFTDARQERLGLIPAAGAGTVCLDEVGSLSPRAQVVLLRLLQDGSYRSIGSTRERRAEARFIALTNTPLSLLVERGTFRADLFYRLCVLRVTLPPLRDRREDILPLALHFLHKHARADHPVVTMSEPAMALLQACDWPGNVRQLENAVLRAAHMSVSTCVQPEDLEVPSPCQEGAPMVLPPLHPGPLRKLKRQTIESFERSYLTDLMRHCHGNVTAAARVAGKERRDMGRLLKKYQIESKEFTG